MDYKRIAFDGLDFTKDVNNRLSLIMHKALVGSEQIYLSPIANDVDPQDILLWWDEIYNANHIYLNDTLIDLDMSNRDAFGPRSISDPWESRKANFLTTFGSGTTAVDSTDMPIPPMAPLVNLKLRPMSMEAAISYMKNNTNSGAPHLAKKGKVKGAIVKDFQVELSKKYPCILFTRTQEKRKTRSVWGFPMSDTLNEYMFYHPILQLHRKLPWRAALRKPQDIDISMTKCIDSSSLNGLYNLSIDFKNFDYSAKSYLQGIAFNYFKGMYQPVHHRKMDYIADRFRTIGIITPDGIYEGDHGIPSGSVFTNEAGSTIQRSIAVNSRFKGNIDVAQSQGDDGAYSTGNPDGLMDDFERAGLIVGRQKSYVSSDFIIYLQMLYHKDYRSSDGIIHGIYPVYRALLRIIYLERFDDFSSVDISGKDYFAIRTISILENCKHHPLFQKLVKFIWSLDKYKLKVSDRGISEFVKLKEMQEGKDVKFSNWLYGDEVRSIRSFKTYQYIKELNS